MTERANLRGCSQLPAGIRFVLSYETGLDPSDCWIWIGTRSLGYGRFMVGGRLVRAHRFSWEHQKGPIPDGMHVCHRCDNPACVNPAHLFVGTDQDNSDDKVAKDRQARGKKVSQSGEKNPNAKLTRRQVEAIRNDPRTRCAIAEKYGVTPQNVSQIKLGHRWKDGQ